MKSVYIDRLIVMIFRTMDMWRGDLFPNSLIQQIDEKK